MHSSIVLFNYFPIQKVISPILIDLYRLRYNFGTTKIKISQNRIKCSLQLLKAKF